MLYTRWSEVLSGMCVILYLNTHVLHTHVLKHVHKCNPIISLKLIQFLLVPPPGCRVCRLGLLQARSLWFGKETGEEKAWARGNRLFRGASDDISREAAVAGPARCSRGDGDGPSSPSTTMWRTRPLIPSGMALFLVLTLFCSCVFYLNCTISQNCILYNYIPVCAHLGCSFCVWASISYNNCMIYNLPIGFIPHMYTYYSDQTLCMNCCNLVGTYVCCLVKIKSLVLNRCNSKLLAFGAHAHHKEVPPWGQTS